MADLFTSVPREHESTPRAKQHRRSRSGCFTCRLRRKKCDEGKPSCSACKHLGLKCEYQRPTWWGNVEQRKLHKEYIKDAIRRTQLAKKSESSYEARSCSNSSSPPALCHHAPSPASLSEMSPPMCNAQPIPILPAPHKALENFLGIVADQPAGYPYGSHNWTYDNDYPFADNTFHNNALLEQDAMFPNATSETFLDGVRPAFDWETLAGPDNSEAAAVPPNDESTGNDVESLDFFEFPGEDAKDDMDAADVAAFEYFKNDLAPLVFPVLNATLNTATENVVLSALDNNKSFRHCCLAVAALHMKGRTAQEAPHLDMDAINHRCEAVGMVCRDLERDINHEQILETTLALMLYPTCTGRPDDTIVDIPWYEHFKIAQNLMERLDLHHAILTQNLFDPNFNTFAVTLAAWVDILGATMRAQIPVFADTWRQLMHAERPIGLSDVMGCDDHIMYIISEIARLDSLKEQMDEISLCELITSVSQEINTLDPSEQTLKPAVSPDGVLQPQYLAENITALFRLAARIYLLSLIPGHMADIEEKVARMVADFAKTMDLIPSGMGLDRSLAWPTLIAGSKSTMCSSFRTMLEDRIAAMGEEGQQGSFARVNDVLTNLWAHNDLAGELTGIPHIHWRDVMKQKGMDCLLL